MLDRLKEVFGIEERRSDDKEVVSELISIFSENVKVDERLAMGIPAVAAAVNLISSLCAGVTFKLCDRDDKGRLVELKDDKRVNILNRSTGSLMTPYATKRAFVRDYLLNGEGYIYIERRRNDVRALKYVESVNVGRQAGSDVLNRDVLYYVQEKTYLPSDFIRILRNSPDGIRGRGLCAENALAQLLITGIINMLYRNISSGGMKKGFLQSKSVLNKKSFAQLKSDFKKLYSSVNSTLVYLNKDIVFTPAVESSTESNVTGLYDSMNEDIWQILGVSSEVMNGKATEEEFRNFLRSAVMPILNDITDALNDSLLLEKEKEKGLFWKADLSEIEAGDLKRQLEAYKIAIEGNIMQIDEVRDKLGYAPLGFNWLRMDLSSVFIDTEKGRIYTPNTNAEYSLDGEGAGKVIDTGGKEGEI